MTTAMPRDAASSDHPSRHPLATLTATIAGADPLYKQVRAALVRGIASGDWKAGERLPNEGALARHFGVGISTVRVAIGELVALRVLVRRQGKGTWVCREEERRNVYQFFSLVRDDGVRHLPVSELLHLRRARANPQTAEMLRLPHGPRGAMVYLLRNRLTVDDVAIVVSDIAVSAKRFPGLTTSRIRDGGPTLYAAFQSLYGVHMLRIDEQLRARRCKAADARALGLTPGEPVLEVHRVAYTFHDEPVEVRRSVARTTDYHYALSRGGSAW